MQSTSAFFGVAQMRTENKKLKNRVGELQNQMMEGFKPGYLVNYNDSSRAMVSSSWMPLHLPCASAI